MTKKNKPEGSTDTEELGSFKTFRRAEDWERLAILEVKVNDHEEDIAELIRHQERFSSSLERINRTLLTIRTGIYTSVVLFVLFQLGLKEFLKLLI